ncbi:tetratricopeptide repeat protein [Mucilaginibacter lappiensis]|uniref:Tetratricopeptide (TPR) repeat protein n=1 Tax=Mucilaginibacter lappiensis TaxID=354630 RepID=A0A841JI06_9SPHI|nr:hypothetical protein [Mucilaginibacter lappiensis]MBB6130560.1 tetratricopeptide (TPR) repeat protein [Mucilaginibacter lappiensis]
MKNLKLSLFCVLLLSMISCKRSAESYYKEAADSIHAGNFKIAEHLCTNAIELKPDYAFAYAGRGMTRLALHNYPGSLSDYEKALSLDPNLKKNVYYGMACDKHSLKDYPGALELYEKAISIEPKDAGNYAGRALTKIAMNDLQGALNDYNEAINLMPNHGYYYLSRGLLKNDMKDKNNACIDLKKARQLGDKSAEGWMYGICN